jgi:hypothetical protein
VAERTRRVISGSGGNKNQNREQKRCIKFRI